MYYYAPDHETNVESLFEELPKLLGLNIGRIFNLQCATLGHNLLGSEWALGVSPSRVGPPLLDSVDLVQVLLVLGRKVLSTHVDQESRFCCFQLMFFVVWETLVLAQLDQC